MDYFRNIMIRNPSSSGLVEIVLVHRPCSSLYEFVLQRLHFLSQLVQLLLLLLNLFVC